MMRWFTVVCSVCLLLSFAPRQTVAAQNQQDAIHTNADVIKLLDAGLGEAVIVQTIGSAKRVRFDTSADALVELKKHGATDAVIGAMLGTKPSRAGVSLCAEPPPGSRAVVRRVKDGAVDEAQLYATTPPAGPVAMSLFSATDADIVKGEKKEETKTMQADGPRILAERFASALRETGPFPNVTILEKEGSAAPDGSLVSGKFTEIDPGSRAKRYFVGFGSGKSAISVEGLVCSGDGTLMARFAQRRLGVMGAFGGDSLGKMAADMKNIGEDLAKFMNAWATGKLK